MASAPPSERRISGVTPEAASQRSGQRCALALIRAPARGDVPVRRNRVAASAATASRGTAIRLRPGTRGSSCAA